MQYLLLQLLRTQRTVREKRTVLSEILEFLDVRVIWSVFVLWMQSDGVACISLFIFGNLPKILVGFGAIFSSTKNSGSK